jgi:very-short-patch-repair endonuclease
MRDVEDKTTGNLSKKPQRLLDRAIVELMGRQHGVASLAQLAALGLAAGAVRYRVRVGRLYRIHRGVFALSPQLSKRGRWMAAVLACGQGAVLSHRSAADLWGLRANSRAAIDVTVARQRGRRRRGIDVHRADTLVPADITVRDGIPCTTVARTLLDLAEVVNRRQLKAACRQAEVLGLFDLRAIDELLERAHGRRGAKPLRTVVAKLAPEPAFTRSDLELRFLALCKRATLPRPQVNRWVELPDGGDEVDFTWPERKLAVETDGWETHRTRSAFEEDRRRDQRFALAGWRVIRFTWRQILDDPGEVEAVLHRLLGQEGQSASVSR